MAEPLNDKNRFVRRWIDSREQGETVMPFTHSKQGEAAAGGQTLQAHTLGVGFWEAWTKQQRSRV